MAGDVCGGQKRQGEGTCKRPAGWGTDHPGYGRCKLHSGSSPSGRVAGANAQAEAEVQALAAKLLADAAPISDPLTRLLKLAGETDAWLTAARTRVGQLLDAENLTTWSESGEQVRALVQLYERAMDRTHSHLASIAKLEIEKRLSMIAERDFARLEAGAEAAWRAGKNGSDLDQARAAFSAAIRPA